MGTADDPNLPSGWFSYPINDADHDEPVRPWNDPSWRPPIDDGLEDAVTSVKLMPEYGVELPLWGLDWWHLGLSADLFNALADWQEQFDINFDPETGWTNEPIATEWARRAAELVAALRAELPPAITLTVSMWPIPKRRERKRIERQHR